MTRVLFDENMPRMLRRDLPEFEIRTVQEEGWSGMENGELLRLAQTRFEVFVTADQRIQHQQSLRSFTIAVVVVAAQSSRLVHMRGVLEQLRRAIAQAIPGSINVVSGA